MVKDLEYSVRHVFIAADPVINDLFVHFFHSVVKVSDEIIQIIEWYG